MEPRAINDKHGYVKGCEYVANTPSGIKTVRQLCPCLKPDDVPKNCPMYGSEIVGMCSHGLA